MNESLKDENIKNNALKILIKEADLSERVKNCLIKLNLIYIEDLVNLSEKDLLSIRDLGRKSLREINYFIEQYGLKLRSTLDSAEFNYKNNSINVKLEKDYADKYEILSTKILNTTLSIRTKNCLIELNIKDLGEAIQYGERELLRAKNFGKKSLNELNNYLAQYNLILGSDLVWPPEDYEKILKEVESKKIQNAKIDANSLLDEINNLLKTRERYVLEQRFWFGRTLEEIDSDFVTNVTRERVRQIESKALRKIKNLLELNIIKFLEENKNSIFLQYSASQQVVTEKSLEKEKWYIKRLGRKDLGLGTLVNMTDGGDGVKGWVISEQGRINMSNAKKGFRHTAESNLKNKIWHSIPIIQMTRQGEYIRDWDSTIDASRGLGFKSPSKITDCCRGTRKTHKNFTWKYKNN